ncbi:BZ3500_MvSof-1268-A1-R1_Chr7-1g09355 [Microbotryum saponariae]|uniref:BZ3500_MvSof-1268-A1-R1_Chr7-1g09355 protein n=1 Tax=Microbotryum saponariae TaxID=289078 RepID=A0A2X0L0T6_9BASI|nr:BZ3501_MvSof-1269-A2-R1_Chr7-1g09060 [Microbotryum saponariae]SDA03284.1 BZ3500_MvSof-1268-A1-R1_Chr7-1g09355 [Microbotryum saponariae]
MAMLICNSDTNTGDRGPQDLILQVHGDRCPDGRPKYQVVSSLHPSAMPLRYPLLFPAGEDGFHPNIPLCGFHQAGPPIARNREQIDNGVQLREVLAGLGLDDEDEEEDEDRDDEDEDGEEGEGEHQGEGLEVDQPESCVPNSLHTTLTNAATISQSRVPPGVSFSRSVIDGYSQVETDRLNSIRLHQENLLLTTAQGIAEAVANGLTPDQMGRYQGTMACVFKYEKPSLFITVTCIPGRPEVQAALGPKDQACNRPDLIARVFEAKLNRLCDDGNKQGTGCFGAAETEGGMAPDLISPVYLHSINPSDFPAHHLRLRVKEGIPVVLLRNLDPDAGLCNGTCLIVLHARSQSPTWFHYAPAPPPLRVALATTINKVLGQSLDCVGVDLSLHPVFTHGRLYVALSRAMSVDRIKVLLPSRDPADDPITLYAGSQRLIETRLTRWLGLKSRASRALVSLPSSSIFHPRSCARTQPLESGSRTVSLLYFVVCLFNLC